MRAFLRRLADAFRRGRIAREFDDEMAFHLEQLTAEYRRRGLDETAARAAAAREFGNVLRTREDLRAQSGFRFWDEFTMDLRHAGRALRRRPTLSIAVIVILALGLGAAITIDGLINTVFLRPLPVSHPEELYALDRAEAGAPSRVGWGTVHRLEHELPPGSVAAFGGGSECTVQLNDQPAVRVNVRLVNGSFFATLGLPAAAGRLLSSEDDVLGNPPRVAVCSYGWAHKNFNTAAAAVGREIIVNQVPITIVGVLPEKFHDVSVGALTELWLATALQTPLRLGGNASISEGDDRKNDPDWTREERISWLQLLVRAPGRNRALVARAFDRAWSVQRDQLLMTANDDAGRKSVLHRQWVFNAAPRGESRFRASFVTTGILLGTVVAIMLVLVCTNVSGLLLVRAMSRHREVGVRLAIGAGLLRVLRPALMEALILSVAGGAAGLGLATWLLPAAAGLVAPNQDLDLSLGLHSVAVMIGLVIAVCVASILAPGVWIARVQPLRALSGQRGLGAAPVKLGRLLVVAQFALAVALVAVATTLGTEVRRTLAADPGFAREQVTTAVFDPSSAGYNAAATPQLLERLRTALLGVPGVKAVSFASNGLLAGSETTSTIFMRGKNARIHQGTYQHDAVVSGFFPTTGVVVLAGRDFSRLDTPKSQPVAIVTAAFAREIFGDANPLGETFGFDAKPTARDWTIVGVIADVRTNGVRESTPAMFYTSSDQSSENGIHFIAVRFEGSAAAVQPALRAELARLEPALVFSTWKTLETRMAENLSGDVATTQLATIFGGCAMVLAGAGIAASLGYLVLLRQRELALRMAIGADASDLMRGVVLDALKLSLGGAVIGVAIVWLAPLIPVVAEMLHGRPGLEPALWAILVAGVAAAIASIGPARRASHIDPMLILKSD